MHLCVNTAADAHLGAMQHCDPTLQHCNTLFHPACNPLPVCSHLLGVFGEGVSQGCGDEGGCDLVYCAHEGGGLSIWSRMPGELKYSLSSMTRWAAGGAPALLDLCRCWGPPAAYVSQAGAYALPSPHLPDVPCFFVEPLVMTLLASQPDVGTCWPLPYAKAEASSSVLPRHALAAMELLQ